MIQLDLDVGDAREQCTSWQQADEGGTGNQRRLAQNEVVRGFGFEETISGGPGKRGNLSVRTAGAEYNTGR